MTRLREIRRRCRYCPAETRDPRDRRVGFSCCRKAIEDQVEWRSDELARLRREAEKEQATVLELERNAAGSRSDDVTARARRARARFDVRLRDHYVPRAGELKADLERYEALRDGEDQPAEEPVEYPRPYRKD